MAFAPKSGCPMCGIVAQGRRSGLDSPLSPVPHSSQHEILWRDDNFTVYRERGSPVSSKGHIIIAFNLHVPSIYTLSSSDLPLLVTVRELGTRLLTSLLPPSSPLLGPQTATPTTHSSTPLQARPSNFRIGFITPPFRDNKIPVTDHLHAHAYILPADQLGWFRSIAYGALAWYDVDDLIAEIRESVSNNRVKSGYANRAAAPIDMVPDAGARAGTANGKETTQSSVASPDIEEGRSTPTPSSSSLSPRPPLSSPSPGGSIPRLQV
ncbi:hypothetical protein FA95DRAFT_1555414 [Auriscalpium vulgare]|uniref:Uncharacterized protein n=1 Tax=Auriscalpium vulgare TaxID=40419 RepID=A0ACB8S3G7_9AGAM|nr:hypothetical protein FA95DRAFT_1555414 [Auriscalpium vulgare]